MSRGNDSTTRIPAGTTGDGTHHRPMLERIVMNAKLLFAATLGLALVSPWVLAGETSATGTAATADAGAARFHHTDYDDELASRPAPGSLMRRQDVLQTLNAPADRRLVGPLRSRTYNPYGTETMRDPVYSRADVKSEVLEARAEHTLRPAGEAGDPYVVGAPRREAPRLLARRP